MATERELKQMDAQAAHNRLVDITEQLRALQDNPQVSQYASGEYIDEMVSSGEAALVDLDDALENIDEEMEDSDG